MYSLKEVFLINEVSIYDVAGLWEPEEWYDLDQEEIAKKAKAKGLVPLEKGEHTLPVWWNPRQWRLITDVSQIKHPEKTVFVGLYEDVWWEAKTAEAARLAAIVNQRENIVEQDKSFDDVFANEWNQKFEDEVKALGGLDPDPWKWQEREKEGVKLPPLIGNVCEIWQLNLSVPGVDPAPAGGEAEYLGIDPHAHADQNDPEGDEH